MNWSRRMIFAPPKIGSFTQTTQLPTSDMHRNVAHLRSRQTISPGSLSRVSLSFWAFPHASVRLSWYTIQTHTGHRSGSRWLIDLKPVMLIVHTHTNACYSHTHKTHCIPAGILRHHQSMANTNGIPAVWILFIIYLLFFISIGSCVHPFLFIYLLLLPSRTSVRHHSHSMYYLFIYCISSYPMCSTGCPTNNAVA